MSLFLLFATACSDDDDGSQPDAATSTAVQSQSTQADAEATTRPGELTPQATETPVPSQAVDCPTGASPGLTLETTVSDGEERTYRLFVPSSYDASKPLPLVLNFHGFGSTAEEQELYSGFNDVAEDHGFVVVTPDGSGFIQEWYVYRFLQLGYVDDFAFVDQVIEEVSDRVCIDEERIYATGISNGGAMTSLLGCQSDRMAAIAPIAGSPYRDWRCEESRPVPVIAFHGTEDGVIPFEGGRVIFTLLPVTPVRGNMHDWAVHNGCDLTLHSERIAEDVVLESYTDCEDNADVLLYVIEGGGHTWPGTDVNLDLLGETTQSIKASELIWSFFEEHP